jgi:hypothetical protein
MVAFRRLDRNGTGIAFTLSLNVLFFALHFHQHHLKEQSRSLLQSALLFTDSHLQGGNDGRSGVLEAKLKAEVSLVEEDTHGGGAEEGVGGPCGSGARRLEPGGEGGLKKRGTQSDPVRKDS